MKRILVIGCPGSGKSTFSRKLRDKTGLPLYYLDMIFHKPDRTIVLNEEFDKALDEILKKDSFILDGNYHRTLPLRLKKCDTVFWLDYPLSVCLAGIEERRGKEREDMPWIETEPDLEFIEFIKNFDRNVRPLIENALKETPDVTKIIFHSRDEAYEYLKNVNRKKPYSY